MWAKISSCNDQNDGGLSKYNQWLLSKFSVDSNSYWQYFKQKNIALGVVLRVVLKLVLGYCHTEFELKICKIDWVIFVFAEVSWLRQPAELDQLQIFVSCSDAPVIIFWVFY